MRGRVGTHKDSRMINVVDYHLEQCRLVEMVLS